MEDQGPKKGGGDGFPITRVSAIVGASSTDQAERTRAYEVLVAAYWTPAYKYIRFKWGKSRDDAEDLTQGFFAQAMEKSFFSSFDPARARFRTFLRTCLDGYVANQEKAAHRIKRGGGVTAVSLDFETAENEFRQAEPRDPVSVEEYFEAEWVRSLFALAIEALEARLKSRGKEIYFRLFERYVLDDTAEDGRISYQDLAAEYNLPVTSVTNYLAAARREFRTVVLAKLRELTVNDEEFRREARSLLGVEPE